MSVLRGTSITVAGDANALCFVDFVGNGTAIYVIYIRTDGTVASTEMSNVTFDPTEVKVKNNVPLT